MSIAATLRHRLDLIEAIKADRVEFARGGGGGGAKSAKGGKAKAAKKAKGLGQGASKGGRCCKTPDGKFAKGNNYGSKGGGSGGSLKAGGKAGSKALGGLVARSKAAAAAAPAKAAAVRVAKARKAAAKPSRDTAIRRLASRSQSATLAGATAKAQKEVAKAKTKATEGRSSALKKLTDKSRVASGRAGAANAALKRAPVTAENMAVKVAAAKKAQKRDVKRTAAQPRPKAEPVTVPKKEVSRKQVSKPLRGPGSERFETRAASVRTRPETLGRDVAADVAKARAKADAGRSAKAAAGRAASLKKLTNKSRVASGMAGAKQAAQKRAAAATAPVTRGIGGREPDLRNVAPAGRTSAAARVAEARGTARERMVRASREAAQGARMVARKREAAGGEPSAARLQADKASALKALGPKPQSTSSVQNDAATRSWLERKADIEIAHVPPVAPPPPSLLARPVSDPARLKAESAKLDEAFARSPGARDNFVPIAAVQRAMPHLSRPELIAVINKGRDDGKYGLDSSEGQTRNDSPLEKAAAIQEGGSRLIFISRRDR